MGVLQQFERGLEGAVEGFFARAFRSGLQPVELAKAIQRYAADHQHVTPDGVVVPNVYRVLVSPRDHQRLSTFGASLPRELGEVVVRTCSERHWILRGPVKVRVAVDDGTRVGRYRIQGRVEAADVDNASPPSSPARAAATAGSDETLRTQVIDKVTTRVPTLAAVVDGAPHRLDGQRATVGRHSSCAITLQDSTVSREHAAFVRRGDEWWVVDLGSTNGTSVNGIRAAELPVEAGDTIEFGGVTVELVEA
ncbi:MAG: DUF3662 and FHA domain-containing protein [Nitriliruptoraceae bacterium]